MTTPSGKSGPLKVTILIASGAVQYWEPTTAATLAALAKDILDGRLPYDASTSFETNPNGNSSYREGTLLKCALKYPEVANLYAPVRYHAGVWMRYGILAGAFLACMAWLVLHARVVDVQAAIAMEVMSFVCGLLCFVFAFQGRGSLSPVFSNVFAVLSLLFGVGMGSMLGSRIFVVLGAAVAGGVLASMPARTAGAIIGLSRRRTLPRANDAPPENVALLLGVPVVASVAVWAAYLFWAGDYFSG